MRLRILGAGLLLLVVNALWAASPEASSSDNLPLFRVQAAEVRVTFTATADHNRLVTDLSRNDFQIVRDRVAVEPVTSFSSLKDAPLSLVVLSDVSDSMRRALPMEAAARKYVSESVIGTEDELRMLEFGAEIQDAGAHGSRHLTSMYDSALDVVQHRALGNGRHAVLLISDGDDNYSLHTLGELITTAQKNDVAFYTVNVGRRSTLAEESMHVLAERTGGHAYFAKDESQILKAVQAIENELRNSFVVTFRADTHNTGLHQLALQATQRKMKFFHRTSYFQPGDSDRRRSESNTSTLAMP
jgi:hypothetical protein